MLGWQTINKEIGETCISGDLWVLRINGRQEEGPKERESMYTYVEIEIILLRGPFSRVGALTPGADMASCIDFVGAMCPRALPHSFS